MWMVLLFICCSQCILIPALTSRSGDLDDDFHQKIRRFVASKADLLFSLEGKQKLQRGVDYDMNSNQEGNSNQHLI